MPDADRGGYSPYLIDWRFLPERVLVAKDLVRPHTVRIGLGMARHPLLAWLWRAAIGKRTRRSLETAGMLFIHIPKTGGTSISQCLYGRNLPHYTASFYATAFPDLAATLPSFAVIRDPVERLKSSYRFIRAGGTEMMATNRYAKLLADRVGSFDGFIDLLYAHPERIHLFEILESQTSYIQKDGCLLVDHLFALHTHNGLPQQLHDLIGVLDIPHLNATRKHPHPMSSETAQKIAHFYRSDIDLFDRLNQRGGAAMSVKGRALTLEAVQS